MSPKIILPIALAILSLYLYTSSLPKSHIASQSLWESWKQQYSKSYSSPEEESYRYSVFQKTYQIIQDHNAKVDRTYTQALNKFSDLTLEEFSSMYLNNFKNVGNDPTPCPSNSNNCPVYPTPSQSYLNWTEQGAVTPVKDQETCGNVYAFTTTGQLEALNFFETGKLISFSEQQITDCDTTNQGCDGGYPYLALNYTAQYGIETEAEYPYRGMQTACKYNASLAIKEINNGYLLKKGIL